MVEYPGGMGLSDGQELRARQRQERDKRVREVRRDRLITFVIVLLGGAGRMTRKV